MESKRKGLDPRHIIYLLLLILVGLPIVRPVGIPLRVTLSVQSAYDYIESLPEGSTVMAIFDITPSGWADVGASSVALIKHVFEKNLRVIAISFVDLGAGMFDRILEQVPCEDKVYGVDYVNLGFVAGMEPSVTAVMADIHGNISRDRTGKPLSELPIMQNIRSAEDIDLVLSCHSTSPGTEVYIRQVGQPYKVPVVSAAAAGQATRQWVYFDTGQIIGLLPGLRGGAEYETLINQPGYALSSMDALSFVHLFILGLIAFGNIQFLRDRLSKGGKAQ